MAIPGTENASIQRFERGVVQAAEDTLVTEAHVAIERDGHELIRTTCSPGHMRGWALGYLFSEGLIREPADLADLQEVDGCLAVRLADSAPRSPASLAPVASDLTSTPDRVLAIAHDIASRAAVFDATGGTHVMALAFGDRGLPANHEREAFVHGSDIVGFAEDISRTCALEKAVGFALSEGADLSRCIAFLSSRVPSRMISKLARCRVPIVAAVSAPTVDAVRLAESLNLCLCGFVRGERLNVYAHGWRLGL